MRRLVFSVIMQCVAIEELQKVLVVSLTFLQRLQEAMMFVRFGLSAENRSSDIGGRENVYI